MSYEFTALEKTIVLKIKRMLFYKGAKLKHEKHQSRHEKHQSSLQNK